MAQTISKPVSVWNKPLTVNFKDFFKALSKSALHSGTGQWDKAAKDLIDAAGSVSFKGEDCSQAAWQLIYISLNQAFTDLTASHRFLIDHQNPPDADKLAEALEAILETQSVELNQDFLQRPRELALLQPAAEAFAHWLQAHGVQAAESGNLANRLPSQFLAALDQEWINHQDRYACLRDYWDSPFAAEKRIDGGWHRYREWLKRLAEEQVFNETFTLQDIYIPLRAYWVESDNPHDHHTDEKTKHHVVDLMDTLINWAEQNNKDDALRMISGGPGSGKSSFCKMLAAKLAQDPQRHLLFIPLNRINVRHHLQEALADFINNDQYLGHNPLEENQPQKLLIIFDGLDELSQRGQAGQTVAREFIDHLRSQLDQRNLQGLRLQALLVGRPLAMDQAQQHFRNPEKTFFLLPYQQENEEFFSDPNDLLQTDQRHAWWQQFGALRGVTYEQMPTELYKDNRKLNELTAQPLLNYLIALSYERGQLEFSQTTNLNLVYEDLIKNVYERGWENNRQHRGLEGIELDDFMLVLEEIAISAWHSGDVRNTKVSAIRQRCSAAKLDHVLEGTKGGEDHGITQLLAAFYFHKTDKDADGNDLFEFTHKSFGEYLVVRAIKRLLEDLIYERSENQKNARRGKDEANALQTWAELCGPTALDEDLNQLLQQEIALLDKDMVIDWQQHIIQLINYLLRNGMPMEKIGLPDFKTQMEQARNAEEALLAALSACANRSEKVSDIAWPEENSFGTWLKRLQGQRIGAENTTVMSCLNYLNISDQIIHLADIHLANMKKIKARGVQGLYASLIGVYFYGADLKNINLGGANLQKANFYNADLSDSIFGQSNLHQTRFVGADIQGADLRGSKTSSDTTFKDAKFNSKTEADTQVLKRLQKEGINTDKT